MESLINADVPTDAEVIVEPVAPVESIGMDGVISNLGDDYKDNATLGKFKSAEELAKSYIDLEKLVGSKVEKIPTNESTPEELADFYSKVGLQEGEEYNITLPDGLSNVDGVSENLTEALAMAKQAGLSEYQAKAFFGKYLEHEATQIADYNTQMEAQYTKGVEALKTEYGDSFQPMMAEIKNLQTKLGVFDEFETSGLNNNPMVISMLGKIASQMSESSTIDKTVASTPIGKENEISEINSQITDLLSQGKNVPDHLTARLTALFGA